MYRLRKETLKPRNEKTSNPGCFFITAGLTTESDDQREREVCASLLSCGFDCDPRGLESITVEGDLITGRDCSMAGTGVWLMTVYGTQEIDRDQCMGSGYKPSGPIPSDTLPLRRLHLLKVPSLPSNTWAYGEHFTFKPSS